MVARLPESEADDAWRARFGPWRSAPTHDQIWDGIANAMRARALTLEEFQALKYELKLKRVLPRRIASALATRKHSKLVQKSERKTRKSSLKGIIKGRSRRRSSQTSDTSNSVSSETSVVTATAEGVNVTVASVGGAGNAATGRRRRTHRRGGSADTSAGTLESMSSEDDLVQLDRYFSQVDRLDGLKKAEMPPRNYSWTEELLRMTVNAVHAEDKENARANKLPSTPESAADGSNTDGDGGSSGVSVRSSGSEDEFQMLLLRLRDPEEHQRSVSGQLSEVEFAQLKSPSSTSVAYEKWQQGGVAVHGGKRGTIAALSMAVIEDLYDAVVQLSGLGEL
jgi:hypothetical protein